MQRSSWGSMTTSTEPLGAALAQRPLGLVLMLETQMMKTPLLLVIFFGSSVITRNTRQPVCLVLMIDGDRLAFVCRCGPSQVPGRSETDRRMNR